MTPPQEGAGNPETEQGIQTFFRPPNPQPETAHLPHVLLILDQFPKSLGGGERIVLRLAQLLPAWGFRVSILTFSIHPQSAVHAAALTCPVYLLPLQKTYDLTALRGALALGRFLRQQKIVLVQTFFESSDLWAGLVVKALSRARLVWSRRDMGILRAPKHQKAYRLLARMPDRVFAVSEQVRRHAIEVDGIEPARVETIYNGLDLPDLDPDPNPDSEPDSDPGFQPTHQPPGSEPRPDSYPHPENSSPPISRHFVITTVGNIRRVKGHDLLLHAAAEVLQHIPEASFSIAGEILEPDFFAELQQLRETLGLADSVHFLGGITNLHQHLGAADLFVLPSRSEGFSNAIIEAMANRLPVVATRVGGNAEAVADGLSGLIVPPEDAHALALAILQLLRDPARMRQMGQYGKQLAADRFTSAAMMRRISAAYANLLSR